MHAEAITLLTASEELENNDIDSLSAALLNLTLELVNMVAALNPPLEVDWRAFKKVYEAWRKLKMMPRVTVQWLARGENDTHVSYACQNACRRFYWLHLPHFAT
jgi:hypothetical protein